ncbi:SNF2-related protein [Pseudofrankia sp. BMG5.36]|uniref:SNF2-related protein n=1 Tax=Pseudofrankia sp. BMG5.36 TaxID=1834512 RepID=UPI0008DA9651|nr:SNF2-related protein [Pseudofrankia sp. BMG5.36]OHV69568.1 helicase [Pseudofrankia sp. BMG5.36]
MVTAPPSSLAPPAPGARVLIRDEEWLVRGVTRTQHDGYLVRVVGASEFVRGLEASFFDGPGLDTIVTLRPEDTQLVRDGSTKFRRSRLYLEAVLRRTPLPRAERRLTLTEGFLLDKLEYQWRPAQLALAGLQPRILIADVVGLGKTLEIGLLLGELIRRGRGERLLVVTPQHVLEQFQHELWTRFSIPLVRLDSVGIERIQREIPAGRNPFTYFKRVIVSIDTLKNVGMYGHHLEETRWDAVVIDESHNLIGANSLRNRLARTLAAQTEALILASATPHNGNKRSFGELLRMLDPAAIANLNTYQAEDIEHLYIRRTKRSSEVRDKVLDRWADRGDSLRLERPASAEEERVFAELTAQWVQAPEPTATATAAPKAKGGGGRQLFAYTLAKAFLSSHHALLETIDSRLKSPTHRQAENRADEQARLQELHRLAAAISDDDSTKLAELLEQLRKAGVGPRSDARVVIFSERLATLRWLARVVPARLGLPLAQLPTNRRLSDAAFDLEFNRRENGGAARLLHGKLTDADQQRVVEEFSLDGSPVRLLFTGDVASEGVNLHRACHRLIHFDVPWSLIRIEQRNGRIDRYGQRHAPEFAALLLRSATPRALDDRAVAAKLLAAEEEAYVALGTAEEVTGLHLAEREERRLMQDLLAGRTVEESLAAGSARRAVPTGSATGPATGGNDPLGLQADDDQSEDQPDEVDEAAQEATYDLLGAHLNPDAEAHASDPEPETVKPPQLFTTLAAFVDEAFNEVYDEQAEQAVGLRRDGAFRSFDAPEDLEARLSDLPRSYLARLRDQHGNLKLRLTFDKTEAGEALAASRRGRETLWPDKGFITDIHPVVDWLVDKVLVRLDRQQAPVLTVPVDEPEFLVQGVYCNEFGQPTVVEWMAVRGRPGPDRIRPMETALAAAKVGPDMTNTQAAVDLAPLEALVPDVVAAARAHLEARRADWNAQVAEPLNGYLSRLDRWVQTSLPLDLEQQGAERRDDGPAARQLTKREQRVRDTEKRQRDLVERLRTTGEPLLRVLAVLAPAVPAQIPTGASR